MYTISDITVSYNNCNGLRKTLDSLFFQEMGNDLRIQIIVIDGDSSDGTKNLLEAYNKEYTARKFSSQIEFIYISEPDSGIYNAMNKGIALANGDWVMFLNSGDTLANADTVSCFFAKAKEQYQDVSCIDVLYGDSKRIYKDDELLMKSFSLQSIVRGLPFSHQSCFTRMDLFKNRTYDESFEIAGDYEWFLDAFMRGLCFKYVPVCVSQFDTKGISATRLYDNWVEVDRIRDLHGLAGTSIDRAIKRICWFIIDKARVNAKSIERINSILAGKITEKTVTIVVPIYKGKAYIKQLTQMVIENSKHLPPECHIELLFVNDYPNESLENEIENAKALANKSLEEIEKPHKCSVDIILLNNEINQGIHKSRINGLKASKSEYIMFLDQDDRIDEYCLNSQLKHINNADMIVSNGIEERDGYNKYLYRFRIMQETVKSLYCQVKYGCRIISPGQCLIRKDSIPQEWIVNPLKNNGSDDYMLWLLMLKNNAKVAINRDVLYIHTYTGKNVSLDAEVIRRSRKEVVNEIGSFIGKKYSDMILNYGEDYKASILRRLVERINRVNERH